MDWSTAGAVAAALLAVTVPFIAFVFGERRARKSDLDALVSKEVDAKLGAFFHTIFTTRDELDASLDRSRQEIAENISTINQQAAKHLRDLREIVEQAEVQQNRIETLLQQSEIASDVLEQVRIAPALLLQAARDSARKGNLLEATASLHRLCDVADTDSKTLEFAGDIARDIEVMPLAKRLYQRSISIDSTNISATAELLALEATYFGDENDASARLLQLARDNPNEVNPVIKVLNYFVHISDYSKMKSFSEDMLQHSRHKSFLYRHIAIALDELAETDDSQVRSAFEKAIAAAAEEGDAQFANVVGIYHRHLLDRGDYETSERILNEAIWRLPGRAQLHRMRGDFNRRLGNFDEALRSYKLFAELGDRDDEQLAQQLQRETEILRELNVAPVIQAASNGTRTDMPEENASPQIDVATS